MTPPIVGPAATPNDTTTAFKPSANPRSLLGNVLVIIAILTAKMSAPPIPWKRRARMRNSKEGARPESADPRIKTTSPVKKIGFRPIISARRPKVRRTEAITTRYPIMIHSVAPLTPTWKLCAILGRPILTIEPSSVVIKVAALARASTIHLFIWPWSSPVWTERGLAVR